MKVIIAKNQNAVCIPLFEIQYKIRVARFCPTLAGHKRPSWLLRVLRQLRSIHMPLSGIARRIVEDVSCFLKPYCLFTISASSWKTLLLTKLPTREKLHGTVKFTIGILCPFLARRLFRVSIKIVNAAVKKQGHKINSYLY